IAGAQSLVKDIAHDYEHYCSTGSLPPAPRFYLDKLTLGDEKKQRLVFNRQRELLIERRQAVRKQLAELDLVRHEEVARRSREIGQKLQAGFDWDLYVALITVNYVAYKRGMMPGPIGAERRKFCGWIDRELRRLH